MQFAPQHIRDYNRGFKNYIYEGKVPVQFAMPISSGLGLRDEVVAYRPEPQSPYYFYKKGGKIRKAQPGINGLKPLEKPKNTFNVKSSTEDWLNNNIGSGQINIASPLSATSAAKTFEQNVQKFETQGQKAALQADIATGNVKSADSYITPKTLGSSSSYTQGGGNIVTQGSGFENTKFGKFLKFGNDSGLFNKIGKGLNRAGRFVNDLNTIDKTFSHEVEAQRKKGLAMKSLLPDSTKVANFDDIQVQKENSLANINSQVGQVAKTQTDGKLTAQTYLAGAAQANAIEDKAQQLTSQRIRETDAINRDHHYKVLVENFGRSDYNRQLGAEVASNIESLKAKRAQAIGETINKVFTERAQERAVKEKESSLLDYLGKYKGATNGMNSNQVSNALQMFSSLFKK